MSKKRHRIRSKNIRANEREKHRTPKTRKLTSARLRKLLHSGNELQKQIAEQLSPLQDISEIMNTVLD